MRALYITTGDSAYSAWLRDFWEGKSAPDDPLHDLLSPDDLRGEVAAWGPEPHWTVLDALSASDPEAFDEAVRTVCQNVAAPTLSPVRLDIRKTALVVKCATRSLGNIRSALNAATRRLIARSPLADEEFQRAEWWIRARRGEDSGCSVGLLRDLHEFYDAANQPPLPSSRHFRLGHLMQLYKSPQIRHLSCDG